MIIETELRETLSQAGARLPDDDGHLAEVIVRGRRRRYRSRGVVASIIAVGVVLAAVAGPWDADVSMPFAGQDAARGPDVVIYLCDDSDDAGTGCGLPATDADITRLQGALALDDAATSARLETEQEAYERFVELFADHPELVASVDPDGFPASLRVTLADDADPDGFVAHYRHFDGVADVVVVIHDDDQTSR